MEAIKEDTKEDDESFILPRKNKDDKKVDIF